MICEGLKLPNGVSAIVCSRRRPAKRCAFCTAKATKLCDFEKERNWRGVNTCDKPLCDRHAINVGRNRDHCHDHPRAAGAQLPLEGV
jgi:hypothetical protein